MCIVCEKADELINRFLDVTTFEELAEIFVKATADNAEEEPEIREKVKADPQFVYCHMIAAIASRWAIRHEIPAIVFLATISEVSAHQYGQNAMRQFHLMHLPTPERKM
jgi:hypothetical protein